MHAYVRIFSAASGMPMLMNFELCSMGNDTDVRNVEYTHFLHADPVMASYDALTKDMLLVLSVEPVDWKKTDRFFKKKENAAKKGQCLISHFGRELMMTDGRSGEPGDWCFAIVMKRVHPMDIAARKQPIVGHAIHHPNMLFIQP
jgi:hypothetical protein